MGRPERADRPHRPQLAPRGAVSALGAAAGRRVAQVAGPARSLRRRGLAHAEPSGLPVVAFDVCYGPRDYVGAGGVLVAPGDTDGVASALTALLTDEGAREEMSERAREQSLLLTPEAVGETFTRLLEDVVSRPARR
ncbi:glycosyltransferase [Microbacterium testaceum]|uniref:glycosyltransferase n=1 Tax=Microbacterium testaceum TaxID=2033 RepID=UPI00342E791F